MVTYNSCGDATTSKRQDLQGGEIRGQELVLLELSTPWQLRNERSRGIDELTEGFGPLEVYHGHKAFPFSPVFVSLDLISVG